MTMDVVSECPLQVGSLRWRRESGLVVLTVVCKASFTLRPGRSTASDEQTAIEPEDAYAFNDPEKSLIAITDLAPFKPRAEVIAVGYAYAPGRKPASAITTRLAVGGVDKKLLVTADRAWTGEGQLYEGTRFLKMPLTWERAAFGPSNPVGVESSVAKDESGFIPLPNFLPPSFQLVHAGQPIEPVGYGPIAPSWVPRAARLGQRLAEWDHALFYERPIPTDIDPLYFNAAPLDQQMDRFEPLIRIVLEGLSAEHPVLDTTLEVITPRAVIERASGARDTLNLRCDTLWIDTQHAFATLTWRAQIPLTSMDETVLARVVADRGGEPWGEGRLASPAALPATPLPATPAPAVPPATPLPATPAPVIGIHTLAGIGPIAGIGPLAGSLAVADTEPPISVEEEPEPESEDPPTPPRAAPAPSSAKPMRMVLGAGLGLGGGLALGAMSAKAPESPKDAPPPVTSAPLSPTLNAYAPTLMSLKPGGEAQDAPAEDAAPPAVAPLPEGAPNVPTLVSIPNVAMLPEPSWEAPPPSIEPASEEPSTAPRIRVSELFAEAPKGFGGGAPASAIGGDDALFAAVEDERGFVTLHDYVRLLAAIERGSGATEAGAMGIPRAAMMPIVRVWGRRVAGDAKLCDEAWSMLAKIRAS